MANTSAGLIDALLPQIHCGQCGYAGCRPYAEALAHGDADINQCPPGGTATVAKLATLLNRPARPIDPNRGPALPPQVAVIDEAACIGCVKCVNACPVDAIIGAAKQMHSVIADDCTGCELCQPACPVDCIDMIPAAALSADDRLRASAHYQRRQQRLQRQEVARRQRHAEANRKDRQRVIVEAVARSRARRGDG